MKKSLCLSLVSILLLSGCVNSSTVNSEESDHESWCLETFDVFYTKPVIFNDIEYHYFFQGDIYLQVENTIDELIGYVIREENRYLYDLDQSKQFYFDNELNFPSVRDDCARIEGAKEVIFIYTSTEHTKEELLIGTSLNYELANDFLTYGSKEFFEKYLPEEAF